MTRVVVGIAAVVVSWVLAAAALAAFPGENGLLAVQPMTGTGVELVSSTGTGAVRVCPAGSRCSAIGPPSWAPTGRDLVFSTRQGLRAIYPDGSCLDCQFGAAVAPSFTATGTELSFVSGGEVMVDGIDAMRKTKNPVVTHAQAAVWSAAGRVAVQQAGHILAGRPGHLTLIGAGTSPSWAPNGREIAAVQSGWIVLMPVSGATVRRLVRGTAPAFSPDGRFVAYVASGHRLMIARADPGHSDARPVGHVLADAVDWQPKPRAGTAGCKAPPGSVVIGKSSSAVITADGDAVGSSAEMGCLRSVGRERLLNLDGPGSIDGASFENFGALAAPYVALIADSEDAHYGGSGSGVVVYDLRTGAPAPDLGGQGTNCSQGGLCPLLGNFTLTDTGETAASLSETLSPGDLTNPLLDVSCSPDGNLCATIDSASDQAFTSASPLGGAAGWSASPLDAPAGLSAQSPGPVACPSSTLCVAVGASTVWTDVNSTGWQPGALSTIVNPGSLSCPSVSLCVATGTTADGQIAYSTDPAAGASSWRTGVIPGAGNQHLGTVACDPAGACATITLNTGEYVSTNPGGGFGTWAAAPAAPLLEAESCPTDTFCAGLNYGGSSVLTSSAPGAAVQTTTPLSGDDFSSISCPTAAFCAAVGTRGEIATSTSPATGQWTTVTGIDVDPEDGVGRDLNAISCSSASSCVATDSEGHIITSTNPAGGASTWSTTLIDGDGCNDTQDCGHELILANDGHGIQTITANTPGTGPYITNVIINGTALSWNQNGTPESTTLTP